MLTRLMVRNFKSIGEPGVDIELRPLTIFVGPNGGGKSSILEALAFLAQNVGSSTRELRTAGHLVEYPRLSAIAHRGDLSRRISIGLASSKTLDSYRLQLRPDTGEAAQGSVRVGHPTRLLVLEGDLRKGHVAYWTEGDKKHGLPGSNEMQVLGAVVTNALGLGKVTMQVPPSLRRATEGEGAVTHRPASSSKGNGEALDWWASVRDTYVSELHENLYLLSGMRGTVPAQISTSQEASWIGRNGEHVLVLLSRIGSLVYADVNERVQHWVSRFELAKVWAGVTASNVLAGQFVDPVLNLPLNLNLASQGSRQVLSVIVQLFWAKPGSIVMIEEPELSLHPEAQEKLPALFAAAIKDGKQVMITTHSRDLLMALTEAVKAGLPAKDIAVYEINKEPETGTVAHRLEVTEEGYVAGWVPSFVKVDKRMVERRIGKPGDKRRQRSNARN